MRFGTAFALSMAFVLSILLLATPFILIDALNGPIDEAISLVFLVPLEVVFGGCLWVVWKIIGPRFARGNLNPLEDEFFDEVRISLAQFAFLIPFLAASIFLFGWSLNGTEWRYGWILGLLFGGFLFGVGFEIVFFKENLRRFLQVPAVNQESPEFQRLEERRQEAVEFLQELNGEIEGEHTQPTPTQAGRRISNEHRF